MNDILWLSNDTIFDEAILGEENTEAGDTYVTEYLPAIKSSLYQRPDEEELHTSFEEAISDRILALHGRLSRLSNPVLDAQYAEHNTDAILPTAIMLRNTTPIQKIVDKTHFINRLKHAFNSRGALRYSTIIACSATAFMLLGFDIMGFLVLHIH